MLELWDEVAELERRMEDIFRGFAGSRPRFGLPATTETARRSFLPAADVFVKNGDMFVRLELPGIDPAKDVTVTVEDDVLVIHGERRREEKVEEKDYYRMEVSYGSFERHIPLPKGVDRDKVVAGYADGVLQVTVPGVAKELAPKEAKAIPVEVTKPVR